MIHNAQPFIYINKVYLGNAGVKPTGIFEFGNGTFKEISSG